MIKPASKSGGRPERPPGHVAVQRRLRGLELAHDERAPDRVTGRGRARAWAGWPARACRVGGAGSPRGDQFKTTTPGKSLLHEKLSYLREGEHPRMHTWLQPEAERDLRAYIEAMVENNPRELFFTKDWDWESETEYRLLLRGETEEEEFLDVRDALEAVIVGPRFHPAYKPGVWKLCDELEVEPLEIQWEMGPPVVVRMLDPARRPLVRPPRPS